MSNGRLGTCVQVGAGRDPDVSQRVAEGRLKVASRSGASAARILWHRAKVAMIQKGPRGDDRS